MRTSIDEALGPDALSVVASCSSTGALNSLSETSLFFGKLCAPELEQRKRTATQELITELAASFAPSRGSGKANLVHLFESLPPSKRKLAHHLVAAPAPLVEGASVDASLCACLLMRLCQLGLMFPE